MGYPGDKYILIYPLSIPKCSIYLLADFEFGKAEVAYREDVVKKLEKYIHELFPGVYFENS